MTTPSWSDTLDAYEASLEETSLLLEAGAGGEAELFAVPAGLGPLTPEHADRARMLITRSVDLQNRLRAAQTQTGKQLALIARTRTDRPGASYVDAHV